MFPTIPWSDCKNRNKDEQEGGSGLPANRWDVSTPCVWVDNKFTLPSKVCIHLYIYTPWRAAGSHSRVKTWLRTDHCIFSRESSPWAIVAREWATFFCRQKNTNVRVSLPAVCFVWQIAMIVLFGVFIRYDEESDTHWIEHRKDHNITSDIENDFYFRYPSKYCDRQPVRKPMIK